MKSLLSEKYPGVPIVGTNFPVHPIKTVISQAISAVQMGIILLIVMGDKMLPTSVYESVKDNKFGYCVGIWFLGNMLASNLRNTGAFEIAFDGQLIFSKLDTGRMPAVQEIYSGIDTIRRNIHM